MGTYNVGDTVDHKITIRVAGTLSDADSSPVGTLYNDGAYAGIVTPIHDSIGRYSFSYAVPSTAAGSDLTLQVDSVTNGFGETTYFHDQISSPAIVDANNIADAVLSRGASDVITGSGTIDRHSLASMVLLMSNSASTSEPTPSVDIKHPDTDVVLHSYQVVVGPGCPVQEIT